MPKQKKRSPIQSDLMLVVYFDGACYKQNVGDYVPIAVGVCAKRGNEVVYSFSRYAGKGNNMIAEWCALIEALRVVLYLRKRMTPAQRDEQIMLLGDSQVVVRQFNGEYSIGAKHHPFYQKAWKLMEDHLLQNVVRVSWVPREENRDADRLSKKPFKLRG